MEQGYGLVTAMYKINEYREVECLPDVGFSTARHTMKRLGPVLRKVRRRKQGNRDPNSPWAKARQRWVTQLLVRLGKYEFDREAPENKHLGLTQTPSYFDPESLPPLSQIQLVFTKLHVKYDKEGRFSFGVAAVKLLDGTVEGRRCRTFDYSAKNLITITAEEKMVREEIKRVKALGTGGQ
jgi:hypothetical protein